MYEAPFKVGEKVMIRPDLDKYFEKNKKLYENIDRTIGIAHTMMESKNYGEIFTVKEVKNCDHRYADNSIMWLITLENTGWKWTKEFFVQNEIEGDI